MAEYLKCRYCNWKTKLWRTNKKGQRKNGYPLLQEHFYMHHEEEYKDIIRKCDDLEYLAEEAHKRA